MRKQVIETIVPDEVYTDRLEFIDYYFNAALEAIRRRTFSSVLLGHRRMGKTEIFKRVVNRLFNEQDHRDPNAAVPVFFEFPDEVLSKRDFALNYTKNFIRWYAAFRLNDPEIISSKLKLNDLIRLIENKMEITKGFSIAIQCAKTLSTEGAVLPVPEQEAVNLPRQVAFIDDGTIVMFLDEFQNTRLPHLNFSVTGFYQQAVESPRCPHFVTGSAMSILADEIAGRGALYGRFRFRHVKAFTGYWGKELCIRAAQHYGADIPEIMAPVVSDRCGGNPFYINALVQQAKERNKPVENEKILNKMLAVDVSSGFIWAELNDQVNAWIRRINEHGIAKWILYLAAIEKEDKISLERIRKELKQREGADVSIQKIKEVMVKLARGDLIEYKSFGDWFGKVNDPVLNEFLKVWGKTEIEGVRPYDVRDDLIVKYGRMKKRISEYKGYFAEVHMSQILLNAQRTTLDAHYFNADHPVAIPEFTFVHHRYRMASGKGREIDVMGAAGTEQWVCQSKWITGNKIGVGVLRRLKAQGDMVAREKKPDVMRLWLFAHEGLTGPALDFAKKHGVLWSSRKEFDELLAHVGLRPLPDLENENGCNA